MPARLYQIKKFYRMPFFDVLFRPGQTGRCAPTFFVWGVMRINYFDYPPCLFQLPQYLFELFSRPGGSLGQGIRQFGQYVAGDSNTGAYYSGFAQAMQRNCLFIRSAKSKGDRESEVTYVKKSVLS